MTSVARAFWDLLGARLASRDEPSLVTPAWQAVGPRVLLESDGYAARAVRRPMKCSVASSDTEPFATEGLNSQVGHQAGLLGVLPAAKQHHHRFLACRLTGNEHVAIGKEGDAFRLAIRGSVEQTVAGDASSFSTRHNHVIHRRQNEHLSRHGMHCNSRRLEPQRAVQALPVFFYATRNRQIMMFGKVPNVADTQFERGVWHQSAGAQIEGIDGSRVLAVLCLLVTLGRNQQSVMPCVEAKPFTFLEREMKLVSLHGWVMFQTRQFEEQAIAAQHEKSRVNDSQAFEVSFGGKAHLIGNAPRSDIVNENDTSFILHAGDLALGKHGDVGYFVQDAGQRPFQIRSLEIVIEHRISKMGRGGCLGRVLSRPVPANIIERGLAGWSLARSSARVQRIRRSLQAAGLNCEHECRCISNQIGWEGHAC